MKNTRTPATTEAETSELRPRQPSFQEDSPSDTPT